MSPERTKSRHKTIWGPFECFWKCACQLSLILRSEEIEIRRCLFISIGNHSDIRFCYNYWLPGQQVAATRTAWPSGVWLGGMLCLSGVKYLNVPVGCSLSKTNIMLAPRHPLISALMVIGWRQQTCLSSCCWQRRMLDSHSSPRLEDVFDDRPAAL